MKVGDWVLIKSGGYGVMGISTRDVGVIVSITPEGFMVSGLEGTVARKELPMGAFFFRDELEVVAEPTKTATRDVGMFEGQYFRDPLGWVIGPMLKTYYDSTYTDNHGNSWSERRIKDSLEPVNIGESVSQIDPPEGSCVKYNGRFFWVSFKDAYDIRLINNEGGFWANRKSNYLVYPDLAVKKPEKTLDLMGKWVKLADSDEYIKVNSCTLRLENPKGSFKYHVEARLATEWFSHGYSEDSLDLTSISDTHPLEHTIVKAPQGEGECLYATDKEGRHYLVKYAGYEGHYQLFRLNDGDYFQEDFRGDSPNWWKYQMFRTNELPFPLPLGVGAANEMLTELCESGCNQLTRWLENNMADAVVPSLLHRARMATNTRGNIALYLNEKQWETKKLQSLRPGRALRVLLPNIQDAVLEKLVDKFRKDFPSGDYTLHRSFEAEAFKKVYSGDIASMQNPLTSTNRKSLANSCMRKNFSSFPHHPAEAYASGEFEILWTETPEGKIGSRMVVWHPPEDHHLHGTPQMGPVYGTCEYSMDMLVNAVPNGTTYSSSCWVGAKLQRLDWHGDLILPYIDNEQGITVEDDYLLINDEDTDDADCAANVTGGCVSWTRGGSRCTCYECGVRMDEDYAFYNPDDDIICEACYDASYFRCEDYDTVCHINDSCTVYYRNRWGTQSRLVCIDARDEYYTLCEDGEYWHNENILTLADGRALSPAEQHRAVECEFCNEFYLLEDTFTTWDGQIMSKEYFHDNEDDYALNEEGVVVELEKEEAA